MKTIRAAVAGLAILAASVSAQAAEYFLLVPFTSHHFSGSYNEVNPGIGLDVRLWGDHGVQVGTYYNSIRRQTVYAAANVGLLRYENVRLGLLAGGMTGYPISKVFIAPTLSYEGKRWGVDATFLAGKVAGGDNAVGFSFRYRF